MTLRFTLCMLTLTGLAACSSPTQPAAFLPGGENAGERSSVGTASGSLTVRVTIHRPQGLHPDYLSPATKGMKIVISGPTNVKKTVGLMVNARGCKSSLMSTECTLTIPLKSCPSKKRCYKATVTTYDAYNKGKIPPGAHKLSADQNFAFAIRGGNTLIPLTLEGIPVAVTFVPAASSALAGSQASGYILAKCGVTAQTVSVYGVDADHNYIVGSGSPRVSLASDNASQLSVTPRGPSAPDDFTLVPPSAPSYPYGGHTIHLTAKAVPNAHSGGTTSPSQIVNVTYSGDICGTVTEFAVPTASSNLTEIAAGADGALWFTECTGNKIGRITTGGTINEYTVPAVGAKPAGIVAGPDGNLWFGEFGANNVGRITPAGTITEFPVLTAGSEPLLLAAGPDGNIWFTEAVGNNIGRISLTGVVHEFPLLTAASRPDGITSGPDGNLWFVEQNADKIGSITTAGVVNEFSVPTAASSPTDIVSGPDGALWFTEVLGNKVAQATTSGVVTPEYSLPTPVSEPAVLVIGPDGAIWFTEFGANRIGRVTVGGAFTEYPVPTTGSQPQGITVGPDGAIWFVETHGDNVGRLE